MSTNPLPREYSWYGWFVQVRWLGYIMGSTGPLLQYSHGTIIFWFLCVTYRKMCWKEPSSETTKDILAYRCITKKAFYFSVVFSIRTHREKSSEAQNYTSAQSRAEPYFLPIARDIEKTVWGHWPDHHAGKSRIRRGVREEMRMAV